MIWSEDQMMLGVSPLQILIATRSHGRSSLSSLSLCQAVWQSATQFTGGGGFAPATPEGKLVLLAWCVMYDVARNDPTS